MWIASLLPPEFVDRLQIQQTAASLDYNNITICLCAESQ